MMFVLKSTYQSMLNQKRLEILERIEKYNKLVDKYNDLLEAYKENKDKCLSREDLKNIISLCHPDKHGGKDLATEMTRRLLAMRK